MPKKGYIESIVTDQGNGGCNCSLCGQSLDAATDKWYETTMRLVRLNMEHLEKGEPLEKPPEDHYKCPKCGAELEWGSTYISPGGSDF